MEDLARDTARAIVDSVADGDEIDFVPAFAEEMTTKFWAATLRLTQSETEAVRSCVREMTRLFRLTRREEDVAALDRAFADYADLLNIAAGRGLAAGDPLMTTLAAQRDALDFADDIDRAGIVPKTVGDLLAGNLVDGFHTAALASANTVFTLVRHPEAASAVKADPGLLAARHRGGVASRIAGDLSQAIHARRLLLRRRHCPGGLSGGDAMGGREP